MTVQACAVSGSQRLARTGATQRPVEAPKSLRSRFQSVNPLFEFLDAIP
jgi:hypothetical protein